MIRGGFRSADDRRALMGIARDGLEEHRIARRANAIVLLDRGWSCEHVAAALLLDDDTSGGRMPAFRTLLGACPSNSLRDLGRRDAHVPSKCYLTRRARHSRLGPRVRGRQLSESCAHDRPRASRMVLKKGCEEVRVAPSERF